MFVVIILLYNYNIYLLLYIVSYNTIYIFLHHDNICFNYTMEYIIETNNSYYYTSPRIMRNVLHCTFSYIIILISIIHILV